MSARGCPSKAPVARALSSAGHAGDCLDAALVALAHALAWIDHDPSTGRGNPKERRREARRYVRAALAQLAHARDHTDAAREAARTEVLARGGFPLHVD